jgi:XRE family transcriptional regulator, aerobic/anaerobic benzoate catabolism transcriptional regulator
MIDLSPLGEAVRNARQARGFTLRALAEASGLSVRFLSDLEGGKGNISIGRLAQVAGALVVPLAELVEPLDQRGASLAARERAPSIALVGLRGAGKSTVGSELAKELGVRFVELDAEIEAAAALPLGQIFEIHGEAYYRRLEREVLARVLSTGKRAVIATGGGIVTDPESWRRLKRRTKTFWLRAAPEAHYQRVMAQGDLRPMKNRPSAMTELRALLAARAPLYAEAEVTIDTTKLDVEGTVAAVLDAHERT